MKSFVFDSVGSTNETARQLLREGAIEDIAYVLANEQTAGKGSRGRTWLSPRGGIYLSVVVRADHRPLAATTAYTIAAGRVCAESLQATTGVAVHLKPINDLFVDNRKLGGILTETTIESQRLTAVIVGVGINVRRCEERDRALPGMATCLEEHMDPGSFGVLCLDGIVADLAERIAGSIVTTGQDVSDQP